MHLLQAALAEFVGGLAAALVVHLGRRLYRFGTASRRNRLLVRRLGGRSALLSERKTTRVRRESSQAASCSPEGRRITPAPHPAGGQAVSSGRAGEVEVPAPTASPPRRQKVLWPVRPPRKPRDSQAELEDDPAGSNII